jgi:hypothetical protein
VTVVSPTALRTLHVWSSCPARSKAWSRPFNPLLFPTGPDRSSVLPTREYACRHGPFLPGDLWKTCEGRSPFRESFRIPSCRCYQRAQDQARGDEPGAPGRLTTARPVGEEVPRAEPGGSDVRQSRNRLPNRPLALRAQTSRTYIPLPRSSQYFGKDATCRLLARLATNGGSSLARHPRLTP